MEGIKIQLAWELFYPVSLAGGQSVGPSSSTQYIELEKLKLLSIETAELLYLATELCRRCQKESSRLLYHHSAKYFLNIEGLAKVLKCWDVLFVKLSQHWTNILNVGG